MAMLRLVPVPLADIEVAVRQNVYICKVGLVSIESLVLIERDLRAHVIDLCIDLFEDSGALFRGTCSCCSLDESINFRIIQTGLVGSTDGAGVEVHHQVLDHGACGIAADEAGVLTACGNIKVSGKVHLLDSGIDADIFEIGEDNFCCTLFSVVGANDGELNISGIAAPGCEILFCLFNAVAFNAAFRGGTGESRRSLCVYYGSMAIFCDLNNCLLVDSTVDCLTDIDIREISLGVIQVEEVERDGVVPSGMKRQIRFLMAGAPAK